MQTIRLFILFLSLVLFTSLSSVAETGTENNLVLGVMKTDSPPSISSLGENITGLQPDIIRAIAKRAGTKVQLQARPWKRLLVQVESGELDGSAIGYKKADREEYATYLDSPYSYSYFRFYVLKGNEFSFEKIDDLSGKTIGKQRGYKLNPQMEKASKEGKFTIEENTTRHSLIRMLRSGRVDAVILANLTTSFWLMQEDVTDIVALPRAASQPSGNFIWFSKAAGISPEIIDRFNHALETMKRDGTLEDLHQKYGTTYMAPIFE